MRAHESSPKLQTGGPISFPYRTLSDTIYTQLSTPPLEHFIVDRVNNILIISAVDRLYMYYPHTQCFRVIDHVQYLSPILTADWFSVRDPCHRRW